MSEALVLSRSSTFVRRSLQHVQKFITMINPSHAWLILETMLRKQKI